MKNRVTLHYVIAAAAFAVVACALYLLYINPDQIKSLIITIIGCSLVGVGQILIIRQKKKQ
ncbi:hypothetical protein [Pedobacter helvus]|uniref:Uncharacterized protein n=1 Tax=Pedobacter helvus TaxID=2563444 RepID=A0ABW9JFH2_9SPHI|nr:hypothetical protein [Pedobacter ureilyticus]